MRLNKLKMNSPLTPPCNCIRCKGMKPVRVRPGITLYEMTKEKLEKETVTLKEIRTEAGYEIVLGPRSLSVNPVTEEEVMREVSRLVKAAKDKVEKRNWWAVVIPLIEAMVVRR